MTVWFSVISSVADFLVRDPVPKIEGGEADAFHY